MINKQREITFLMWLIGFMVVFLLVGSCKQQDNERSGAQVLDDFSMHLVHINFRIEDSLIGKYYATEKLLDAGNKAIPTIIIDIDKRDAFLVMELNGLLMKMPQNEETNRAFAEIQKYHNDLTAKHSEFQKKSGDENELIFDKTMHWYHRSETAAKLIDKGELPITDLLPLLKSRDLDDQKTAITTLNRVAFSDYVRRKIKGKTSGNENNQTYITEKIKKALSPLLLKHLRSLDLDIGRRSALILGRFGNSSVVPDLIRHIPLVNPYVQEGITVALAELNDTKAIEPLHKLVIYGHTPYVRASAADALMNFQNPSSIEILNNALTDTEWLVRFQAAEVLKSYQKMENIKPFVKLITDEYPLVRMQGLYLIGKFGDSSYKETVSKNLNDPDTEVRETAEDVIYKFEHGEWPSGKGC